MVSAQRIFRNIASASRSVPERGDHEDSTFPELAGEGKLFAYRNSGYWLTVNTPKQLREANDYVEAHPELAPRQAART